VTQKPGENARRAAVLIRQAATESAIRSRQNGHYLAPRAAVITPRWGVKLAPLLIWRLRANPPMGADLDGNLRIRRLKTESPGGSPSKIKWTRQGERRGNTAAAAGARPRESRPALRGRCQSRGSFLGFPARVADQAGSILAEQGWLQAQAARLALHPATHLGHAVGQSLHVAGADPEYHAPGMAVPHVSAAVPLAVCGAARRD